MDRDGPIYSDDHCVYYVGKNPLEETKWPTKEFKMQSLGAISKMTRNVHV